MTLNEKLEQIRLASRESLGPELYEAYDGFIAHLRENGFAEGCLKAGDRAPSFTLPNAEGRLVSRDDLLERGPLIVSFFRGDWCPYCRQELQALNAILPDLARAGATLVAVTPDASGHPARTKQRFGIRYEVLCDLDNGLGLQFGVVFRVPDELRRIYQARGLDLAGRHNTRAAWFLPVPATYVVGRDGIIRHADVDPDYRHRMEPQAIVELVAALSRP